MILQFNCGHFKKANEWLAQRYGNEGVIDWSLVESVPASTPALDNECDDLTTEKPQDVRNNSDPVSK